jgi:hypothetical protein
MGGLSACDDELTGRDGFGGDADHEAAQAFRFAVPAGTGAVLALEGITGSVEIDGVAGLDSVVIAGKRRVRAESTAEAEAHLDELQVAVTPADARLEVRTMQPADTHGRQYIVDYEIRVPSAWEVSAANVTGNIAAASCANGLALRCTTGRLSVHQAVGEVEVDLVTGDIELEDIRGDLDVTSVTGNVAAKVYLPDSGHCDIRLVTGSIALAIPATTSARLTASVVTGSIATTDLSLAEASVGTRLVTGILGSGNGRIALNVTTGRISVDGF